MIRSKKYYLAKTKVQPNTFIGGISGTINTPALVASKLGISASRIKVFSVVGDNIQFAVTGGSYSLPNAAFQNNTDITYFRDAQGKILKVGYSSFNGAANLVDVYFLNCDSVETGSYADAGPFNNCGNLKELYMPKLRYFLGYALYPYSFRNIKIGCNMTVNVYLQSNPSPDITYAINSRAAIVTYAL